LIAGIMLS